MMRPTFTALTTGFLAAAFAPPLSAQGYRLAPGDLVLADTVDPFVADGEVVLLCPDGTRQVLAGGAPLGQPVGVAIDRDGAVLVSSYSGADDDTGVYRIDPASGALVRLHREPLRDNFHFLRDGNGDLIVAEGTLGLARIDERGRVSYFSPVSVPGDQSYGLALDFDGTLVGSEAPAPFFGNPAPGRVFRTDAGGARTILDSSTTFTQAPNGIAIDADGSFLFVNGPIDPTVAPASLVRMDRGGVFTTLQTGGPLRAPRALAPYGKGNWLLTDVAQEAILARRGNGAFVSVLAERDNGDPDDGRPVDRPYALAVVPQLWLTTPLRAALGQTVTVTVAARRGLGGTAVTLAVSDRMGPSSFPGSGLPAYVDIARARLLSERLAANGRVEFAVRVPNDPALLGEELHLQAHVAALDLLSNYVALPVR